MISWGKQFSIKREMGTGIAFFSLPALLKLLCWESMCLEAAHIFLHELLEQRRLLATRSTQPTELSIAAYFCSHLLYSPELSMEPMAFSILCSSWPKWPFTCIEQSSACLSLILQSYTTPPGRAGAPTACTGVCKTSLPFGSCQIVGSDFRSALVGHL